MDDQVYNKSKKRFSFFFQLVNKHLPSDDAHEDEQFLSTKEYILWMAGIMAGFFVLRVIFSFLFL